MNVFEGKVVSEGMKVGIVAARFNEFKEKQDGTYPGL